MRLLFTLTTLLAVLAAMAQPDDLYPRFTNPCGMPPDDSLDVTGDGVPDLMIGGYTIGTDDEPSSSGSCTRYVRTLPGTYLLCGLDRTGHRVPEAFAMGDTVPPFDTKIQDDFRIPRYNLQEGTIPVVQWGYGHQHAMATHTAGLDKQVFVFRTVAGDRTVLCAFTLEPLLDQRSARIVIRAVWKDEGPWIIR